MGEKTGIHAIREESKQKFSNFTKQKPLSNYSSSPADRIVEQVMRTSDPVLQRACDRCDENEKKILKAKESTEQVLVNQNLNLHPIVHENVHPIVHEVLCSPCHLLDMAASAFMEPRLEHDLSWVRVYTDTKATESVQAVNARAFTLGNSIIFGSEQYLPMESAGRKLLAHGLVQTIQQLSGENFRLINNDSLEHEQKTNIAFDHALYKSSIPV
jgi:hypothetical protein